MRGNPISCPRAGIVALLAAVAVLVGCESHSQNAAAGQKQAPPKVQVATLEARSVELQRTYAARTSGAKRVEVRARVQGVLKARGYEEGTVVEAGTRLFRIDPERFRIQVQRAEAELARAEASLRQAQREWRRISSLYDDGAISAQQRDEVLSAVETAKADVALAEATLADARVDLDYTSVEAPVGGVTSLEALPEGSLVQPQTLLTTITQLDPLHVKFAVPEEDALAQRQRLALMNGKADARPVRLRARLRLPDGTVYDRKGVIDFTESAIDPETGTVRTRAVFPNPAGRLLPGQFVRVSILGLTLDDVVVVPEKAVAEGSNGPVVYRLAGDNVADAVPVELGQHVEAGRVIAKGLDAGERVVTGGIISVRPGQPVTPVAANGDDAPASGREEVAAAAREGAAR